ncbi:hypothetical protein [Microvirga arsenatis]|uniref:DUF1843 domain-containing protein n=1 Tax=Microvirga arsenatis TaxID=2692265 RepID=A0ABW9YXS1_9HYPH|nr:hypothetical protein [Microvirga arsenatis]NBJ13245.1 hypothetical protein [Microvirga arsenatis]NBJ25117.1 hypothetical protein [Microvirga arsenatis]
MGEAKQRMKLAAPSGAHKAFHADFADLMKKHLADEPAEIVLAIAAYAVGQIIAMQDQRRITPRMAMEIVSRNIEAGNAHAIQSLDSTEGNA